MSTRALVGGTLAISFAALHLSCLCGPCEVATTNKELALAAITAVEAGDLDALDVPAGTERLLLRTDNSELWRSMPSEFPETYVSVSGDGARWLVEHGLGLVGIDFLGIEGRGSEGHPTHVTLLSNDVVIVEGLDLGHVEQGEHDLVVMPLRLVDGDGGPARAALRRR